MRDPQKATPGGSGQAVAETNTESPHMVAAGACLDKQRHPLSAAFGDMPADEFDALVGDIKRNGQISDIVKAADGSILDGWHRYRACIEAGITPRIEPFSFIIEPAAEGVGGHTMTEAEFVVAQNAHRRHLTAEQRRRIVAELLKADPAKSDRAIGSMAKVDHKTVATVRRQAEAGGEIPHLTKTTGKDGKKYAKPTAAPQAKVQPEPPPDISPQREAELYEQLAAAVTALHEEAEQSAAIKDSVRGVPATQGAWAEVLGQLGGIAEMATRLQESFGDRLQPLPMPVGDMHAKLQAGMAQVAASIAKLSEHIGAAYLAGDLPAVNRSAIPERGIRRRNPALPITFPASSMVTPVDYEARRVVAWLDSLNPADVTDRALIVRQLQAQLDDLAGVKDTVKAKVERLAAKEIDRLRGLFHVEVRKEFEERHPEMVSEYSARLDKLNDEIHRCIQRTKGTDDYMTQDEFRLLQGCLHPDRQPESEKEKYGRAFQIIKRMESRIDPSKRKRMLKGWA